MRTVRLDTFQGPLDLLLTLIEREKLDISGIALAEVTEQYLQLLRGAEELDPEELADFLVVAAKLLVIKSRILLPMLAGAEEEEGDLERQLKLYREYHLASQSVSALLRKRHFAYGREGAVRIEASFSPPPRLGSDGLERSFREVLLALEPLALFKREETIRRTVSLQEKITEIHDLLIRGAELDFQNLLSDAGSRMDVIVTFLALLELVKQQSVVVVQQDMFDPIRIQQRSQEESV
jgi:segregation and condensation protein A